MILTILLLIIGFGLLIKGADYFVDGASSIARKFKISNLIIGLTIVAFGTSSPELMVNIVAAIKGHTDLAIGNIIGSNIANIFLILGIAALISPLIVEKNTVWKEVPLSFLAALVLAFVVNDEIIDYNSNSLLTRIDGLILLSFFAIFLVYVFGASKQLEPLPDQAEEEVKEYPLIKTIIFFLGGLAGLTIGGELIVKSATEIAVYFKVSESLIGLTIVAIGTSLPELATSVMAALKKESGIAIGNIVGSNIFNIFFILGISAVIRPLPFNPSNNIYLLMNIAASLLLFIWMFIGERHLLKRWQGGFFVVMYISYIIISIIKDKLNY